jgi:hypothetical protein
MIKTRQAQRLLLGKLLVKLLKVAQDLLRVLVVDLEVLQDLVVVLVVDLDLVVVQGQGQVAMNLVQNQEVMNLVQGQEVMNLVQDQEVMNQVQAQAQVVMNLDQGQEVMNLVLKLQQIVKLTLIKFQLAKKKVKSLTHPNLVIINQVKYQL